MIDSELTILKENTNEEEIDQLLSTAKTINSTQELVNWKQEAQKGNFMPSIILLEKGQIRINDIVVPQTKETLLHLAIYFGLYNVIRTLIETFNADINCLNWFNQSPLHIVCNSKKQNIYLLAYLLKNPNLITSIHNKGGLTPILYAVINNFNFALIALTHLSSDLNQCDINQNNNLLYFALVNNNRFAVDLILNHTQKCSISEVINKKYYNKTNSLSDILISNKNIEATKYLLKYYHEEISFDSISSCKKNKLSFPFYNEFTYELFNTLYYFKSGDYCRFVKAVIFNGTYNFTTPNSILRNNIESNPHVSYRYKSYMIKYMICNLIIPSMSPYLKMVLFSISLINLLLITLLLGHNSIGVMALYGITITLYGVLLKISKGPIIDKGEYSALSESIHNIIVGNVIGLPSINEICPICSVQKDERSNHCNICKCCIKDFYYHSLIFNLCIHRKNVRWYIFLLVIFMLLFINIPYRGEYELLHEKLYFHTKIIKIVERGNVMRLLIELLSIIMGGICLGKAIVLFICLGMNVSYYNMFRYHKRDMGIIKERHKLYFKIPQVYFVSLKQFMLNLFC